MIPKTKKTPGPFANSLSKYQLTRSERCINCTTCASVCPRKVHHRPEGYNRMQPPRSENCTGFQCLETDSCCLLHCPRGALRLDPDPLWKTLGDARWPADLIYATWLQAETGELPEGYNYETGDSQGGFDKFRFLFENSNGFCEPAEEEINTSIDLNERKDDALKTITIPIPVYGAGMSYGSISLATMLSRAKAALEWKTFVSTGEGGYPEELAPYDNHIITQIATGLFGVREETIQRVRFVEFKYAQGAKPGLGGHLLGDKNTPSVARLRETVQGTSLFSPFPFHSVYSVEDHKKHIDWIKSINPNILISVKVSTPTDIDMVAIGSYFAGAHVIHLDGGYGGTGAAPEIAKKNIAMPIEYAIPKVHNFLQSEGVREEMTVMASGGIRSPLDAAKAIALGADGVIIGTAELVALGCVRCGNCESGRGCPRGIATTDPELEKLIDAEWGAQRIINMYCAWQKYWTRMLKRLGLKSIKELRGRMDLLEHTDCRAKKTQKTEEGRNGIPFFISGLRQAGMIKKS